MSSFSFLNIKEEKAYVENIPIIILTPEKVDGDLSTIVLYHGWSSSKETQRIRGFMLASIGYRVVLPDSINHGERNPFTDYSKDKGDELWLTALNSIEEWPTLIKGLAEEHGVNKEKIGVIGNSMGGIIASGIYTHNDYIKALVVLNGTMAWENTNKMVIDDINITMTDKLKNIESKVEAKDPMGNLELLKDRPILLLHGDADSSVSILSQRLFYESILPKYKEKDKIQFIEYPGLNHYVTTNMMEEAIMFFKKYI